MAGRYERQRVYDCCRWIGRMEIQSGWLLGFSVNEYLIMPMPFCEPCCICNGFPWAEIQAVVAANRCTDVDGTFIVSAAGATDPFGLNPGNVSCTELGTSSPYWDQPTCSWRYSFSGLTCGFGGVNLWVTIAPGSDKTWIVTVWFSPIVAGLNIYYQILNHQPTAADFPMILSMVCGGTGDLTTVTLTIP